MDERVEVWLWTHFEDFQVELEERLVHGSEVLLDTGLAEAVCDATDEAPVFGESLKLLLVMELVSGRID